MNEHTNVREYYGVSGLPPISLDRYSVKISDSLLTYLKECEPSLGAASAAGYFQRPL